jgi:hydrophobe/amphiphile efflux-1 (HAE1) family protein
MANWNISATAIRSPVIPTVLFIVALFAGLTAYFRLPINQLPNIEFPVFSVTVAVPGAAPEELETQVAQKVESALTAIDGVNRTVSTVVQGSVTTTVQLEFGVDVQKAAQDARDQVSAIRSDLPADTQEPVITRDDAAAEPIGYYALKWPGKTPEELSWFIDDTFSKELLTVKGVSRVARTGGVDREVRVEMDPARLAALGVTAEDVNNALRRSNIDLPGGRAQLDGQAQTVRTLGGAQTVEGLADELITLPNGSAVRLGDVATVRDGSQELSAIARFDGEPVISFLIQRSKSASEVKVYDVAMAKIREIEAANPGMKVEQVFTPVDFVRSLHESSMLTLLEGALLAVLVVFIILRDWRATLIAAAAIPLATIPTFAVMEPLGFSLNMITLIALGLVSGVLVDDAIVEVENIVRHMRMGKSPWRAAMEAADEIGLAVVATTLTIVAVFLPVSFMTGVTGQFFKQFGITVAVAVLFSLAVARLITPLMAAYFLKPGGHEDKEGALERGYVSVLKRVIRHPRAALLLGGALFVAPAIFIVPTLPMTFIPRLDNALLNLNVEFGPGTTLAQADKKIAEVGQVIAARDEVVSVFTSVNSREGVANDGAIYVQLVPKTERALEAYDLQGALRDQIGAVPDVRVSFNNFQGGGRGADITIDFVGPTPQAVEAAAEALVTAMKRSVPEVAEVKSSASLKNPELLITPREGVAASLGVDAVTLAGAVRIATGGEIDTNAPKFDLPDRQIPIRVILQPAARLDLETIKGLRIRTANGESVRLDAVADVTYGLGAASIERRDRQRLVTVTANVVEGDIGRATGKVMALPEARAYAAAAPGLQSAEPLPADFKKLEGVSLLPSGDTEELGETVGQFGFAMLWGILGIYFVLVVLFKDFFQPITILSALPLSITGAFLALAVSGQPISLFVFIGLLMLMGIVTKNSILLVDFAIELQRAGLNRTEALMEACRKRARPIIMTTIAMSAGMIPTALGWAADGALRMGMGFAVIGGLLLSTVLSLVLVPAVYIVVDKLENLIKPLFGGFSTRTAGDEDGLVEHGTAAHDIRTHQQRPEAAE